jgi:hypothetical protein
VIKKRQQLKIFSHGLCPGTCLWHSPSKPSAFGQPVASGGTEDTQCEKR